VLLLLLLLLLRGTSELRVKRRIIAATLLCFCAALFSFFVLFQTIGVAELQTSTIL
jgi:lysylphosphatidylglycerol synthetase-like protein (DUF2156 family)